MTEDKPKEYNPIHFGVDRAQIYAEMKRMVESDTFLVRGPERLAFDDRKVARFLHTVREDIPWSAVIGNERAKEELRDAIEAASTDPELYKFYGVKPPRGVCLSGPPGCGKTMLAKAAASAMARLHGKEVKMILLRASEVESKWFGQTEANIRNIFAFARAYKKASGHPCLIFIDEADAMLAARGSQHSLKDDLVATFLAEMDGLSENAAFVILATNRPESLDQALLRDGRIDLKIRVERPTLESARKIAFEAMLHSPGFRIPLTEWVEDLFSYDFVLETLRNPITGHTHMFTLGHTVSGAMIVGLVERAKRIAFRRDRSAKTMTGVHAEDFAVAIAQLYTETKGMNHSFAIQEFIEDIALPAEVELERRKMN